MSVHVLTTGQEADEDNPKQRFSAWYLALENSLKAREKFPALDNPSHQEAVQVIKEKTVSLTGFKEWHTRKHSNFYHNYRQKLSGLEGPGSSLKFFFHNQRSFTEQDAFTLHNKLKEAFPREDIAVCFRPGKLFVIVQVGLKNS